MLDFWYSARCSREMKVIISILTCVIIYYCATIEKLSPTFTVICLAIGISTHLLRMLGLKIAQHNVYAQGFKILFSIYPLLALMLLMAFLPAQHKILTSIHAIGFAALGLFIMSIYQNRAKRFD